MGQFQKHIRAFNTMYRLPCTDRPTLNIGVPVKQRLFDFKAILIEELNEIDEIIDVVDAGAASEDTPTSLADLLGDIQVYCASEMAKFGIPLDETLEIIMQSNFSKMGADGKPIYDERGKLQKGPNYWKPEPRIAAMLAALNPA